MERTKRILNIAIAISIVLCSMSIFIYSISPAKASTSAQNSAEGYIPVGIEVNNAGGPDIIQVIGYNKDLPEGQKIKILARQKFQTNYN